MSDIEVKVFNTPTVYKKKKKILFPFRKAEALFYYLLVKGEATREELVNLLWGEIHEETAKKNLRNAMYKIRKVFNMDIIISPQKSIVMLNPEIPIASDLHIFLSKKLEGIEAYTGEFLQGFYVKEGETFEEWMATTREQFKDLYIAKINDQIESERRAKHWSRIEPLGKLLINVDPFDERAYRILMEHYIKETAYNKGIELYLKLCKTLESELGIKPDIETREIYEALIKLRDLQENQYKNLQEGYFYGRSEELALLKKDAHLFMKGEGQKSYLIIGEAGIGKTRLKDQFLQMIDDEAIFVFTTNCYQAEENYVLKPWNSIFSKISDVIKEEKIIIPGVWRDVLFYFFPVLATDGYQPINLLNLTDSMQYSVIEEAIRGLFKKLTEKKRILLVFDDLQWIDPMSLSLLSSILIHDNQNKVMFIGTCRNGHSDKIEGFTALLTKYNLMEKMEISRFDKVQVKEFIEGALPNFPISDKMKEKLYYETEGNTFFLVEFINSIRESRNINEMSTKMKDILNSRLIDISKEGRNLLNIISLFFDKAPLDLLIELIGKDEMEVMEVVEELQNKWLIKEDHKEGIIGFQFTHQKLREFIYQQQSMAKKKLLHNKIALILEKELKNEKRDMHIYSKLIYHFSSGGNNLSALKYQMKNVDAYLDFTHELYPVLTNDIRLKEENLYLTKKESKKQIDDLEKMLQEIIDQERPTEKMIDLQLAFYHMKGRFLIREGEYENGIYYIQEMISHALEIGNYHYRLKGFKQMIYYGIQTYNIPLMKEYLQQGLEMVHYVKKEEAIFLRLKGVSKIMSAEYDEAEEILKQSIGLFNDISKMDNQYALNIAASYNYLGEIRRHKMQFNLALYYYDKAMAICEEKNVTRGLTIFSTNGGQSAFDMGDYDRAKIYFSKALKLYRQFDIIWGRSIAEGYTALLQIKKGNYKGALDSLKRAEDYGLRLKSPYELGLLCRVKAEIKSNMKNNHKLKQVFVGYLTEDLEVYCTKGISYLKQVKGSYEIQILEVLKKDRE